MSMTAWAVLLLCLVAGTALLWGGHARKARSTQRGISGSRNPYHSVEIRTRRSACHVAHMLEGRRFLSDEAPLLPLPRCNAAVCRCIYSHFDDRRAEDRRGPFRSIGHWYDGELIERRLRRGRRKTDQLATYHRVGWR